MSFILFAAVVLVVLALLVVVLKNRAASTPSASSSPTPEPSFESCGELFTPAERSFYGVLQQALGDSFVVFGKVRLGDVVQPIKGLGKSLGQTARNKINLKHLDFVICKADGLSLVTAVELDDSSHQRKDRGERDAFVDQALKSAGIPLVRFAAKKGYELAEVKTRLAECRTFSALPGQVTHQIPSVAKPATPNPIKLVQTEIEPTSTEGAMICPACQAEMVRRQAKKGPHAGRWFWACSTFPKCRKAVAIGN